MTSTKNKNYSSNNKKPWKDNNNTTPTKQY